ncbi:MAG: TraB/GumN family protein [Planctomycetota bacterium]
MNTLRRSFAAIALLVAAALPCQDAPLTQIEKPLLWRIELPTPSYLYGTIHLPDERVTTLPAVVTEAIDSCGALYTEIPMELDKMMAAAKGAMQPAGSSLADEIGAELYARTKAYVESRGAKMQMFDRVRPWVAATQLTVVDIMPQLARQQPLDMQLYAKAKKAGKTVGGLETVESQLAVFDDLTLEEQCSMLTATLDQLEKQAAEGKNPTEELLQTYLRGDEAGLDKVINEAPLGDDELHDKLEQRLLANRNGGMVDRIVEELQKHPGRGAFFAVGAAHHVGEQGVVALLIERGYRVTRVELKPGGAAARTEADAIDAEIARRTAEIEALKARRAKLLLLR